MNSSPQEAMYELMNLIQNTSCSAVIKKFVISAVTLSGRSNNIFSLLPSIPQSILQELI
jgi:hypothetical protein